MNPQNTGDPPPQALRSPRRAWTYVTAATFKFKYAGAAFLVVVLAAAAVATVLLVRHQADTRTLSALAERAARERSEEHTSELQSPCNLVCRLLLEKKTKLHSTTHEHTSQP